MNTFIRSLALSAGKKVSGATLTAVFALAVNAADAQGSSAAEPGFARFSKTATTRVMLSWANDQDKQVSHFVLERSPDGTSFREAALIFTDDDNILKEYNYADRLTPMAAGQVFYRLKIVDKNGNFHYSEATTVQSDNLKTESKYIIKLK